MSWSVNIKKNRIIAFIAVLMAFMIVVASCGQQPKKESDRKISEHIEKDYLVNQPIPRFTKSQYRQSLIELERAQAESVVTTAFFFNQGVADPIDSCQSIGFPIPTTAQLSNPTKVTNEGEGSSVINSMEPTGVYTGDSSGTYVMCIDAQGSIYANYWEGFVKSSSAGSEWDYNKHRINLIGSSSYRFTKVKKK